MIGVSSWTFGYEVLRGLTIEYVDATLINALSSIVLSYSKELARWYEIFLASEPTRGTGRARDWRKGSWWLMMRIDQSERTICVSDVR